MKALKVGQVWRLQRLPQKKARVTAVFPKQKKIEYEMHQEPLEYAKGRLSWDDFYYLFEPDA